MPTYEFYELSPLGLFFFVRLLPLLFVLGGGCVLAYVRFTYGNGEASRGWPTVKGVITRSDRFTDTTYIDYRYVVNGTTYTNDRLFYGPISESAGAARSISRRYPVKSSVKVHYKPSDPETSVLQPGVHDSGVLVFAGVLGGIFLVGGVLGFVFLPGMARKSIAEHAASDAGGN